MRIEEGPPYALGFLRGAELTVDAGIGAVLARNVVDAQALAEPARGHRTEGDLVPGGIGFAHRAGGYFGSAFMASSSFENSSG